MKNIKNKTKILIAIIAIIIIVGFAITLTIGLNFELRYQDTKRVELNLGKDFEIADIKAITNEVFANKEVIIQKVEVFEDTVSIQAKDISEEEIIKVCRQIGLDKKIMQLPNGYDTVIDAKSDLLSYGEKQLLSFARAILKKPKILTSFQH